MGSLVLATVIVGEIARREPPRQPQREAAEPALIESSRAAVDTYEREGKAALISYMDQMEQNARMRVFLFDHELNELSGRRTPFGAREIAQRVLKTNAPEFAPTEFSPLVARPVEGANEAHYAFVAELPRRQPPPFIHHVAHILGLLLIGGAFCYWLARYLTAPVKKLRIATQELARGNLSARVGLAGNRRDELVSLGSDFDLMAEKIESLVQAQRRLLGDISHELRSPLARLNVALELARQRSGNEAVSALARIQREAETLNEMIGQLLTLTRLQTGAEEIQKAEFDLCGLVREIADDAEFEAKSGNRSVSLESDASCTFVGNELLVRRAIENVVRNAVHYTREGTEVEIEVNEVIQDANGKAIKITVRDHGPGVPEPALGKIFRPFYRVDEARDREAGGVGLGLAIAERAVKLHNGSINARNAAHGGLAITITLDGSPQFKQES